MLVVIMEQFPNGCDAKTARAPHATPDPAAPPPPPSLTAAPAPFSVQARSFLHLDAHGNPRPIKEASYRRVLRKMFMGHRGFDNKNRQTSYNETSVVQMEMTDGLQAVAEAHAPHDDEHALGGKQSPAPHGDEETGTRDVAASQSSV